MRRVYTGARIYTGVSGRPQAWAMAVQDGRVVAFDGAALDLGERVDLGGRVLVPGFHDAHAHTMWFGLSQWEVDLSGGGEFYRPLREAVAEQPAGKWIVAGGFTPAEHRGQRPVLAELDQIAPRNPLWIRYRSGHASVVNSLALQRIDFTTLGNGGTRSADGYLEEGAHRLAAEQLAPYGREQLVEAIGAAHKIYLRQGITSVQDAGVGAGLVGNGPEELAAYRQARDTGALRVRTTIMPAIEALDGGTLLDRQDPLLRLGPTKVFTDGSVLAHTALLSEGFPNGDNGYLQYKPEWYRDRMLRAHQQGWQLAVHAQGDAAIEFALDIFAEAQRRWPRPDPRHRVEHASLTTEEQLVRFAELGAIPNPQGEFIGLVGDGILETLADPRDAYRSASFLRAGLELPGSSDRPCSSGVPLHGIRDMITRRTASGRPLNPDEALTVPQALRAYSHGSAYAAFAERELGTLTIGKQADFTLLEEDPHQIPATQIGDIGVAGTAISGVLEYDPNGLG